jgi:paraquat-inducible protein A
MGRTHPSLIACEHCGSIHHLPVLARGETCVCPRCLSKLWRHSRLGASHWVALALAALIVFMVANYFPVARMSVQGMTSDATLLDAVRITLDQGKLPVAFMTAMAGFFLPLLQLLLLLWVLVPLAAGRRAPGFRTALRVLGWLDPWCMVPVFLLGAVVAVVKLAGMASVAPSIGLAAFGVLVVLFTMLSRLSPHRLWRLAEAGGEAPPADTFVDTDSTPEPGQVLAGCHACGLVQPIAGGGHGSQPCLRCGAPVHGRKPESLSRTWALLISAAILYVPANVLPVMNIASLFGDSGHTILGGVIELWSMGSWDIALIVFVASVAVPLVKMLSLAFLAWRVQAQDGMHLRQRTRLYEFVELIGQWSMLDVFVVILLAALADFKGLMEISAGAGAAAFGGVVILTMLAAMSFDPRRAWDHENTDEEAPAAAVPTFQTSPGK